MFGWLRRYGVALVCILLAVLGLTKVKISGLEYSEQEIMLAVLGLLAIDNLAERTGVLQNLQNLVKDISGRLPSGGAHRVTMTRRNLVPRLADVIEAARKEVILVGPSLDTVVGMAHRLEVIARAGIRIRILLSAALPDTVALYADHMAFHNWVPKSGQNPRLAIDHLRNNYAILDDALHASPNVEIRLFDKMIWCSYVIIDPTLNAGNLAAHVHMYKTPIDLAPFIQLSRTEDAEWFLFFLASFERVWSDSRPLVPADFRDAVPPDSEGVLSPPADT